MNPVIPLTSAKGVHSAYGRVYTRVRSLLEG